MLDTKAYLLDRYGLRMNKRELCFESKSCRAKIDNKRSSLHRSFDRRLVDAQVDPGRHSEKGVPVLFHTSKIADWLDASSSIEKLVD